jgi:hypothetical protein
MLNTIDLTGLSTEAAMAVPGWHFLCETLAGLVQIAKAFSRDGLDRDEINPTLKRERVELEAWRKKSLAELRCWLERDGQKFKLVGGGLARYGYCRRSGALSAPVRIP